LIHPSMLSHELRKQRGRQGVYLLTPTEQNQQQ
jgi:hypothetical protein